MPGHEPYVDVFALVGAVLCSHACLAPQSRRFCPTVDVRHDIAWSGAELYLEHAMMYLPKERLPVNRNACPWFTTRQQPQPLADETCDCQLFLGEAALLVSTLSNGRRP